MTGITRIEGDKGRKRKDAGSGEKLGETVVTHWPVRSRKGHLYQVARHSKLQGLRKVQLHRRVL